MNKYIYIIICFSIIIASLAITTNLQTNYQETTQTTPQSSEMGMVRFEQEILQYFRNETYIVSKGMFTFKLNILMARNMNAYIDEEGLLHILLISDLNNRSYVEFNWHVFGNMSIDFPHRFNRTLDPGEGVEIYSIDLGKTIETGKTYELLVHSSIDYIVIKNFIINSLSDEMKLQEIEQKIRSPIITANCRQLYKNSSFPYTCNISIPKYFLWIKISKEINISMIGENKVLKKPNYINVEFIYDLDNLFNKLNIDEDEKEEFIELLGGRNFIAILIYITNNFDKDIKIIDCVSFSMSIHDAINGKAIGNCRVMSSITKPDVYIVKPGKQRLFYMFLLIEENDSFYLRYGCWYNKKINPGSYIIDVSFFTDPYIHVSIFINLFGENEKS